MSLLPHLFHYISTMKFPNRHMVSPYTTSRFSNLNTGIKQKNLKLNNRISDITFFMYHNWLRVVLTLGLFGRAQRPAALSDPLYMHLAALSIRISASVCACVCL